MSASVKIAEAALANRNSDPLPALRCFTICARNFLPNARVLFDSVRRHHPDAVFTVYLCDRDMGYDPAEIGMPVVGLEHLGVPDIEAMIRRYNITELCTAIKPFCFLREFAVSDSYGHEEDKIASRSHVIYCDPDLELFSPLEEVVEALDAGAPMVMTPHILYPTEHAEFTDRQYLQLGIYNLGFLATRDTAAVRDLMAWWGRQTIAECVIDLAKGLFVDQKWADLFPSFLDNVHILRHPGYNIAYWNLHERRVQGEMGSMRVNGLPMRFAHYSGVILDAVDQLSRHSQMYTLTNCFGYGALVERYRERINSPEFQHLRSLPSAFLPNGPNGINLHATTDGDAESQWRRPAHFLFARQFFSLDDYADYKQREQREIERRRTYEKSLIPENHSEAFSTRGYCFICDEPTRFVTNFLYSTENDVEGRPIPNWREHLACSCCGLPNRIRASMHLFLQEFVPEPNAKIYITERKTRLYDWLASRFPKLVGSEYFGDDVAKGALVEGIRNENMEDLSFEDGQFHFLLSFDVMEHVAHADRALKEAFRVLAPGGWMFFTAPAYLDRHATTVRAELNIDGSITHHTEPEYHGNPVDPEGGALCFRYFGWDLLDQLRAIGFSRPFAYHYWSRECGYLGPDHVVFVAQKP